MQRKEMEHGRITIGSFCKDAKKKNERITTGSFCKDAKKKDGAILEKGFRATRIPH